MSNAGLPAADRFEWFTDMVARDLVPVTVTSPKAADFRADAGVLDLGPVRVSAHAHPPLRSRRPPALTRRSDPEQYQLALVNGENPMWISQRGHDSGPVTGELVLWDTSRPFEAGTRDERGTSRALVLHIPRAALPVHADKIDRLLARRIPARHGTGAILARFLTSLGDHAAECGPDELEQLGRIARDLAAVCLAEHADATREVDAEARSRALLERIKTFIEHNLDDPGLAPGAIAARHHISVRSLHLLFQGEQESVGRLIRRRRLERCRADLARPELAHHPVHAIASRWGFSSAAVFSRAFREAYGLTPREHRRQTSEGASRADRQGSLRTGQSPPDGSLLAWLNRSPGD
ncbi:helix-turn-helix domain-containing protein [Kitasatospora sp. NPDC127111]|uniref:AraC-like ligand-binding domain-containing protein n=1 Tax=Kitasatospora sp. NPDC127111 TaxID=3345363 RepID=UPI00362EA7B0